jgi:hypothetical protein
MRTPKVDRAPEKERAPGPGQAPPDERSAGPAEAAKAPRKTGSRTSSDRSWFQPRAAANEADADSTPTKDSAAVPASEAPADDPDGPAADPARKAAGEPPAAPVSDEPGTQPTLILTPRTPPAPRGNATEGRAPAAGAPAGPRAAPGESPAEPPGAPADGAPGHAVPVGPPTQPTLILTVSAPSEAPAQPASAAATQAADAGSTAPGGAASQPPDAPASRASAGQASKAVADPGKKKARSSRFGSAPDVRPDVLTDAETVVLPQVESDRNKALNQIGARPKPVGTNLVFQPSGDSATAERRRTGEAAALRPRAVAADDDTQILSAVAAPPAVRDRPAKRYKASRRKSMLSRGILLGILCLQALMSLRLRNTAFQDEALYLYSGRLELNHILHGASLYGNFSSFFPGAPVFYPVLGAALDQAGGLVLARALSLVEMLAVTALCYSIARYLFNERIGLCAAAIFSVAESTLFLCDFATVDATSLFLLAVAAWIMVFTARSRWPVFLLAAPVAALAVTAKYSSVLWIPTIAVLPVLTAWPDRLKRVWLYPVCFLVVAGELLFVGLQLGGHAYATAVKTTTTNPAHGVVSVSTVMADSLKWGGVLFALAVVGSIAYVWRVHTETDEQIAPAGSRLRRAMLGLILTATALLAPAYQAYLHSDNSLQTYIGFGLFFAAPMAGFGLVRIMGDYFRWPQIGIAIFSVALVLGLLQSNELYHGWPQSTSFVKALSPYLKPNANYLVEVPDVPIYYLQGRSDAQPKQFTSTFPVAPLNTAAKFAAAVKDGEFQVIAYNDDITPATDNALAKALKASSSYTMVKKVYIGFAYGSSPYYYIWVKHTPVKAKAKATPAKAKAKA